MRKYVSAAVAALCLAITACAADTTDTAAQTDAAAEPASSSTSAPGVPRTCPNPHGGVCLGELKAGTYTTSVFEPPIEYTVTEGWRNDEDLPGNFLLYRTGDPQTGVLGGSYVGIYQNVNAAAISCAEAAQEDVGSTPEELVKWYQSVPGLIVSDPRPVTVGGLDGYQIDLSLEPDNKTCRYASFSGIPLIIGNGTSDLHHVILHEIDVRLVILGWKDGNVTLEITNVKERVSADDYRAMVQPIIDSLKFG